MPEQVPHIWLHRLCARDGVTPRDIRAAVATGAGLHAPDEDGQPPLGTAILHAKPEIVAELLRLGAEPFHPAGNEGCYFNALALAVWAARPEIVDLLLQNGAALHVNKPGIIPSSVEVQTMPCLHMAVRQHEYAAYRDKMPYRQIIEKLVRAGGLLSVGDTATGKTPLMIAASMNSSLIQHLTDLGADIDQRHAATGETALQMTLREMKYIAAENLLDLGADPNCADASGETPLMLAARHGKHDLAKALVARGADPSHRQSASPNWTPLMEAAKRGNTDTVNFLLDRGADPLLCDAFNRTAAKIASDNGNYKTYDLLSGKETEALQKRFERAYEKKIRARRPN